MLGVEAVAGKGVKRSDLGQQIAESLEEALPSPTAMLAAPPKLSQPLPLHIFPERP